MAQAKLSTAMEDYLKAIFHMEEEGSGVATVPLASRLRVAPPSVTHMIKRLQEQGLVLHTPYRGIELTPTGRLAALEVVRHHRLIELYLAEFLEMPWDRVHDEADRLEHVLSEELEERIATKVGSRTRDPHGAPIPSRSLFLENEHDVELGSLPAGNRAVVVRVPDEDPALLQYLSSLGLVPGAVLTVEEVTPFGDVFIIRMGETLRPLGPGLVRQVLVKALEPRAES